MYGSAPLDGKTLEEWLTVFAGPVGNTPGNLKVPLKMGVHEGKVVSGTGVYAGPNGAILGVIFMGVSFDGENVHPLRMLFSNTPGLMEGYKKKPVPLLRHSERERGARREAGSSAVSVPTQVAKAMKQGGKIVPGVYVGNQYGGNELRQRLRR